MSLEKTITELVYAVNRLSERLEQNTQAGNRIISTLSNSESNFNTSDDATSLARGSGEAQCEAAEAAEAEATAPAPAPAKRVRRTRAELSPAMPPSEDNTPDTPPAEVPQDGPAITLSDIREHALGYRDRNGLDAARALLATFKVERIGDLDYNQYGDFIKACAP